MTLTVDRRPRDPRTKRGPPLGRFGTGLRPRFPGRAEIANDREIRRPELQPLYGGELQWPHLQRPVKDLTRCARSMPEVAAKPMASARHLMGSIPPITGGGGGPRNRHRGILPLGDLLVAERHPRNQIRRYARRAARSGFRSGASDARPAPSWRAGWGWVISPNFVVRVPFP